SVIPLEQVRVGDTLLIHPGERVPLDGVVQSGEADVDESALTGEAVPRWKGPEASVMSGSINLSGALRVRVTRPASQSTLSRIVQLVESARGSQARAQRLLDRFVVPYLVLVLAGATLTAVLPP